jgi:hypothetical protein
LRSKVTLRSRSKYVSLSHSHSYSFVKGMPPDFNEP